MAAYKKYFWQTIRHHYPHEATALLATTDSHYTAIAEDTRFAATSSNPIDRRLDFCAYFLALIKTLDERGESFETIRAICLEVVLAYVKPKNKLAEWVKRLPVKIIQLSFAPFLIRLFHKKVSKTGHKDGFRANIITNKNETYGLGYGIDILECGICKLFNKHHYSGYSSILCEVDEVTSALAGLQLIRHSTIALGAQKCDFRFKKIEG